MPESAKHGEDGDHGETSTGELTQQLASTKTLWGLTTLTKELKDFKQDLRWDLGEFKNEITKAMKDNFREFKEEVLQELQVRIANLESACLEMKATLLMVVKQNMEMRDKIVNLESR